STTLPDLP
ncbi:unnamed protein product, partial [Allacma fusca]